MSLISRLSARLQNHPKRIVFPEGADARVIQAATTITGTTGARRQISAA